MWDMNEVVAIEYKDGFVYHVVFDDGKSGNVELSEYLEKDRFLSPCKTWLCSRKRSYEGGTLPGQMGLMSHRKHCTKKYFVIKEWKLTGLKRLPTPVFSSDTGLSKHKVSHLPTCSEHKFTLIRCDPQFFKTSSV